MIDTILLADEQDETLGFFFGACINEISEYLTGITVPLINIRSQNLNEAMVSVTIEQFSKFVFIAYSHGSTINLTKDGITPYISTDINQDKFKNSFFYNCSCLAADSLAPVLVKNGCLSFIGYKKKYEVWGYTLEPFINTANYGIKLFFEGNKASEIIQRMKDNYTEAIDTAPNQFAKAMLVSNRNALTHIGKDIHIDDLLSIPNK